MHLKIGPYVAGFTLVEILVAMAILAMIFTIVFGTFFYTIDNAEEREERAALYHRASYILSDISRCASSACVPFGGAYVDKVGDKSVFSGEVAQIDNHDAASLSVFTTNTYFSDYDKMGEIAYVSYKVAHSRDTVDAAGWINEKNNPLVLSCTAEPLFLDSKDKDNPLWLLNLRSFNIEFYDGSGWLSEWSYEERGELPDALKLELELADSEGETHSFSTIAFVHANTSLDGPS